MTDTPSIPTTFPVETDVTEIPEEVQMHSSNYRSVTPTDTQALTALQSLISDDFQAKNTHSTQRKEKRPQIYIQIYKMKHSNWSRRSTINSSKSNGIFKGSIHYISIRTNSTNSRQVLQSISNSTNKN